MSLFFYFIVFIFGLVVGSFLNVVIYRLRSGENFLLGRSHCPACGHTLSWEDLFPLFSFVFLRGKCRYCHKKISVQYSLVELGAAVLFVLIFWKFGFVWNLEFGIWNFSQLFVAGYLLLVASLLIIIFVFDLKNYIIPDGAVFSAIGIAFLYQFIASLKFANWNFFGIWNMEFGILRPLLAGFLAAAFFLAIILISRGKWMGMGDAKLAFFMGLFLGYPNILAALFLAFFTGAIMGVGLIILGRKKLQSEVPFGPFLIFGTFIALFWGQSIINWYLNFLII